MASFSTGPRTGLVPRRLDQSLEEVVPQIGRHTLQKRRFVRSLLITGPRAHKIRTVVPSGREAEEERGEGGDVHGKPRGSNPETDEEGSGRWAQTEKEPRGKENGGRTPGSKEEGSVERKVVVVEGKQGNTKRELISPSVPPSLHGLLSAPAPRPSERYPLRANKSSTAERVIVLSAVRHACKAQPRSGWPPEHGTRGHDCLLVILASLPPPRSTKPSRDAQSCASSRWRCRNLDDRLLGPVRIRADEVMCREYRQDDG